jgi:hypothetical protein
MGIPGLTLLILALQTCVIGRQANIMDQQTALMRRESEIAETQRELASRPNILTSFGERGLSGPDRKDLPWKIENKGPYAIRELRLRVLHFMKFVDLGWQDSVSGEGEVANVLNAGQATTVNLGRFFSPYSIKGKGGKDYAVVQGSEFYVFSLLFEREIDDKRYLYLQPFHVLWPGADPEPLRLDLTASAGPLAKSCMMDAYAVELTYEFYKRNPLPYPVEPYNYHYLLGMPIATCLQTGPKTLRW